MTTLKNAALPVTFTVSGVDFTAYREGIRAACPPMKRPLWYRVAMLVTAIVIGGTAIWFRIPLFLVGVWAGVVLFMVAVSVLSRSRLESLHGRMAECYPSTYTIDESGIGVVSPGATAHATWKALRKAVSTNHSVIVVLKGSGAFVFPKEVLPAQPADCVAAINERIAAAAS